MPGPNFFERLILAAKSSAAGEQIKKPVEKKEAGFSFTPTSDDVVRSLATVAHGPAAGATTLAMEYKDASPRDKEHAAASTVATGINPLAASLVLLERLAADERKRKALLSGN